MKYIPENVRRQAKGMMNIASSLSSSPYEIRVAMTKQHELLLKYELTQEDIENASDGSLITEGFPVPNRSRQEFWIQELAELIGDFTETKVSQSTNPVYFAFHGFYPDVQRAVGRAEDLFAVIDYHSTWIVPRSVRNLRQYKQGLVDGIRNTMQTLKPNMRAWKRVKFMEPKFVKDTPGIITSVGELVVIKHSLIIPYFNSRISGSFAHSAKRREGPDLDYQLGMMHGKNVEIGNGVGNRWR